MTRTWEMKCDDREDGDCAGAVRAYPYGADEVVYWCEAHRCESYEPLPDRTSASADTKGKNE